VVLGERLVTRIDPTIEIYNVSIQTGSHIPTNYLAYKLVLPEEFIGECVSTAMDIGFLTAPKRGTFGGKITPIALWKLKQVGKEKLKKREKHLGLLNFLIN
jgi:hypothetical protein